MSAIDLFAGAGAFACAVAAIATYRQYTRTVDRIDRRHADDPEHVERLADVMRPGRALRNARGDGRVTPRA